MNKEIKIAVLQRVIPEYRFGLLKLIEQAENIKTLVFYGENLNKKVASSSNINTKSFIKLPISFLKLSNRLSTVKHCDKIYFLKNESLYSQGSYMKLIEKYEDFKKFASQEVKHEA